MILIILCLYSLTILEYCLGLQGKYPVLFWCIQYIQFIVVVIYVLIISQHFSIETRIIIQKCGRIVFNKVLFDIWTGIFLNVWGQYSNQYAIRLDCIFLIFPLIHFARFHASQRRFLPDCHRTVRQASPPKHISRLFQFS